MYNEYKIVFFIYVFLFTFYGILDAVEEPPQTEVCIHGDHTNK